MNKILVAEPIYHAMPPKVYFNRILFWKDEHDFKLRPYVMGPRQNIRKARALAIETAIAIEATHLLFVDDDILLPDGIVSQLLAVDRPIVGGLIHRDSGEPLVWREPRMTDDMGAINAYAGHDLGELVWTDHPKKGAFECAAVAAGCMLIQVHVLKHLLLRKGDRRWLFNYDETERSMDVRFCRMARQNEFGVWCWPDDPCIQIQHY